MFFPRTAPARSSALAGSDHLMESMHCNWMCSAVSSKLYEHVENIHKKKYKSKTFSAPKLRPFMYFRIYSMQSIEETLLHLSCSTSQLRWITTFCWSGCVLPSVTIQLLHGFSLISMDARSTFVVAANVLYSYRHHLWCATRIGPQTDLFHYLYR